LPAGVVPYDVLLVEGRHQLDFLPASVTRVHLFQCVLFLVYPMENKSHTTRVTFADYSLVNVVLVAGLA